jgi:hypothetical protein
VLKRFKDQKMNSRSSFGEVKGSLFSHSFSVSEDLEIDYGDIESLDSYLDTVDTVFQSAVNPVLSKKVTQS